MDQFCKNKNVLVLSDSHGREGRLDSILAACEALSSAGTVEDVIFLGDGARGMIERAEENRIRIFAVCGNCDVGFLIDNNGETVPEERIESVGGKRIFMMHGHTYGVKSGLSRAVKRAAELEADILMFGHTHQPTLTYLPSGDESFGFTIKKGLYVFNPGALLSGSFGVLTVSKGNILLSHGSM